jgi:AcrR family transcriptional regulator
VKSQATGAGNRRRGPRPAGSDTREAILEAAGQQFGDMGYRHTTLRSVGAAAGVDPRLVLHYFGSKRQLFVESVRLPVDPELFIAGVFDGDPHTISRRVVGALLDVLDEAPMRQRAVAIIRAAASEPEAAELIREVLSERLLLVLAERVDADQPRLRASMVASQFVGLVMARYVVGIEPLASASREQLIDAFAPVFEHYLFGDWVSADPTQDQTASGSPS